MHTVIIQNNNTCEIKNERIINNICVYFLLFKCISIANRLKRKILRVKFMSIIYE